MQLIDKIPSLPAEEDERYLIGSRRFAVDEPPQCRFGFQRIGNEPARDSE